MRNKVLLLLIFIASPPRPPDPPRTPIHGECTASRVPLEEYFYFIFFACILFVGLFVYLFSLYVRRAQFFFYRHRRPTPSLTSFFRENTRRIKTI